MEAEQLQRLLALSGYQTRIQRRQVLVEVCVFCSNARWNLELSPEKGVYHCWACDSGGRLESLVFSLTGEAVRLPVQIRERKHAARPVDTAFNVAEIDAVPSAAHYLAKRGIDLIVAAEYGIRVCVHPGHQLEGRIVIPLLDFYSRAVLGWIGRSYTNGRPKYLSTLARSRVTGWRAPGKRSVCVVVEGHLDGIAVHRAGCTAAVLGGTSAANTEEWAARLPPEVPVIVMLDGSARDEALRLYWKICAVRMGSRVAVAAVPPEEDPASLGPERIRELVVSSLRPQGST